MLTKIYTDLRTWCLENSGHKHQSGMIILSAMWRWYGDLFVSDSRRKYTSNAEGDHENTLRDVIGLLGE